MLPRDVRQSVLRHLRQYFLMNSEAAEAALRHGDLAAEEASAKGASELEIARCVMDAYFEHLMESPTYDDDDDDDVEPV